MAFPNVTAGQQGSAAAFLQSTSAAAGLDVHTLDPMSQVQLILANLLLADPTTVNVPAGDVLAGTFGANKAGGADTGSYDFPGAISWVTSAKSITAFATPSALIATTNINFASTVSGAVMMGFGTTNDVTLMNRAGTVVLGITANTTGVVLAGALAITGALSGVTTFGASTSVTVTSASAVALAIGLTGATNPAFAVDSSTGSQAAGLLVTGATAAGTVALAAISSGGAANVSLNAKGTGTTLVGNLSTGQVSIGRGSVKAPIQSNTLTALGTTQNTTPTAAQLVGGALTQTSAVGAGTATLDNGTNISAAVPGVAVGDMFRCTYFNLGGGFAVTITGASGSTVIGTAAVPSGKGAIMTFVNTGTNAWNVYVTLSA